MTTKTACGNCGESGGCGCSTPNPYAESARVVWHDPTDYDALKHGPSYFPGMKLSSTQKRTVQAFVKTQTAAVPWAGDAPHVTFALLGALRGAAAIHQTHHWMTKGASYYSDHLLFERLYNESQEGIDAWAERVVGGLGGRISPLQQADLLKACVKFSGSEIAASADTMVQASLQAEALVLALINRVKSSLEAEGRLSSGTSNLLDGLADKHETFVYLLQQRSDTYEYDRR